MSIMPTLAETIEQLRVDTVRRVAALTGLDREAITIDISINLQPPLDTGSNQSILLKEAQSAWHKQTGDDGSIWYTSVKPDDGGVYLFLEQD